MKIDVLSLFPDMFNALNESIIGKTLKEGIVDLNIIDFRKYSNDKHHHVDDKPYGGSVGMLLKPEPIFKAMDDINKNNDNKRVILLDPIGKRFDHKSAKELSLENHLVFICGHYEGFDERIYSLATDIFSIGDYVITGGELAAMIIIDAVIRLIPGVLGNSMSSKDDSFVNGLLECPHYTRPSEYRNMKVPDVLMSGNHKLIHQWEMKESLKRTYMYRPDLLKKLSLNLEQINLLKQIISKNNINKK